MYFSQFQPILAPNRCELKKNNNNNNKIGELACRRVSSAGAAALEPHPCFPMCK